MFKKLLAMMKSPKNQGETPPEAGGQRWLKTYNVILSNMEGAPSYPLSHQLSIGSEIGNIIIADPSVSPRHATILLQEEVISIMDHGSVAGTFVNGSKIPAGKFIILEDTDKIKVGELAVEIGVKTSVIDNAGFAPPEHEHLEDEAEAVEEDSEDEEIEDEEDTPEPTTVTKSKVYPENLRVKPRSLASGKSKKKSRLQLTLPSYDASSSLIRVLAVTADLLLSFIILVIFLPFDDFREFLDSVPLLISGALDFEWTYLWQIAIEEAGPVTDILKELFIIVNELVPVLRLILVFFIVRLISTIIFGVSISEFMLGVRANFNSIWARVGGVLRVILGMLTWPLFMIFDLPSLVSKRTFKEFITLTNTYVGSRVVLFFGLVFYFPLLLLMLLVSPMVIGLELVEPIPFNAMISQRVKPKVAAGTTEVQKVSEGSRYLGLSFAYDPQLISLIPTFKFKGEKAKLNMKAGLDVVHRDGERTVTLELFKTFDMKELLAIGLRGNILLHDQYLAIYNYAYTAPGTNRSFKAPQNVRQEEMFGKQIVTFTEMAFSLGIDNLVDFMTTKTPLIKSLVDYRSALMALFEYKDHSEMSVVKVGKILCLRLTYDTQKPFDLLMPLMRGEGRIFKITYDSKKELVQLRNKFYKFTLDELTWGVPAERESIEAYKALEVIDIFTVDFEKSLITPQKAQALYGYYFEKTAEILRADRPVEFELWKASVQNVMNVLPHLRSPPVTEVTSEGAAPAEDVREKLRSNFTDLFNALESKNKSFFGIEEVPTV